MFINDTYCTLQWMAPSSDELGECVCVCMCVFVCVCLYVCRHIACSVLSAFVCSPGVPVCLCVLCICTYLYPTARHNLHQPQLE